jgi:pimeloyl-ACP methyl ester carboxylesterase
VCAGVVAHTTRALMSASVFVSCCVQIAADYDDSFALFHACGASLLVRCLRCAHLWPLVMLTRLVSIPCQVVDFRGYGWSAAGPQTITGLPRDSETVATALPAELEALGLGGAPLLLFGRSIGSVWAVHLASRFPAMFKARHHVCVLWSSRSCLWACVCMCVRACVYVGVHLLYLCPCSCVVTGWYCVFGTLCQALVVESGISRLLELPLVGMLVAGFPMLAVRAASLACDCAACDVLPLDLP